jgi:hypothetical protein
VYDYLDLVVQRLKQLGQGGTGRYGLTTEEIKQELTRSPYLDDLIEFLETSPVDLSSYFVEPDSVRTEDKTYKTIARLANSYLSREATKQTLDKLEQMPPNSLVNLLKLVRGDHSVQANLRKEYLTLTINNRFYTEIFTQAKAVVILDGTATPEQIKLTTGLDNWLTIEEKIAAPLANLTINLIDTEGLGSNQWSEEAIARINALHTSLGIEIPAIAFKRYQDEVNAAGYWFKDNIGSNQFKGIPKLIAIGTPAPNYGQVKNEFLALGGNTENFEDYYQDLIEQQILQMVGRQRSHLFPDQTFTLHWIGSNLDLSFLSQYAAKITRVSAYEVNPAAGTRTQILKTAILDAIAILVKQNGKITQKRLAAAVSKRQSSISEALDRWKTNLGWLVNLAEKIIGSAIEKSNSPPDNPDYRDFLGLDPLEEIVVAIEAITALGFDGYLTQIFNYFPKPLQLKLLGYLIATTKIPAPE